MNPHQYYVRTDMLKCRTKKRSFRSSVVPRIEWSVGAFDD
jgi:hypothetical protein